MMFVCTAMKDTGERLTETIEAASLPEAQREMLRRGLTVLNIEQRPGAVAGGQGRIENAVSSRRTLPGARGRELALFARQMGMMLRAGTSVVPAIRAIGEQPGRPAWHATLAGLVEQVEGGAALHEAMARYAGQFPGTVRTIVGAGEATGKLAESFERLALLLESRQRVRKRVTAAMIYPCILLVMAGSVVTTMTLFVLPRFADLFAMLDAPLPWITRVTLDTASWLKASGWYWMVGLALALAGLAVWLFSTAGRKALGRWVLGVPILGRAVSGVILAHLLQIWAVLLCSRVSVLDAIRQARQVTGNVVFHKLIADVEQAVTEGRSISSVLKRSRLVPPPVVSAIATGEDSGRLGESMQFVGNWLEEENDALIGMITSALEPLILIAMGVVVGLVAISLFLPLFDIATAAG